MKFLTLGDLSIAAFESLVSGPQALIKTGIHAVDSQIGGLSPGSNIVIGARTGVGKSTVKMAAVMTAAKLGVKHAVFDMEDTADVVGGRLLGAFSGVESTKLRTGSLKVQDSERLAAAAERLTRFGQEDSAPIFIEALGARAQELEAQFPLLKEMGVKMVWVDYLQKMSSAEKHHSRTDELTYIFRMLQAAAYRHEMSLGVLAQANRPPEKGRAKSSRGDPGPDIPAIYELKGSGDIEIDARCIVMLGQDGEGVVGEIAKLTFGRAGGRIRWARQGGGHLKEVTNDRYDDD